MPRTLSEQEYNDLVRQVMQSAPPNMDEPTYNRWIGGQLPAAIEQAETQPADYNLSPLSAVKGAASMLNPVEIVKGLWNAAPIPQALGGQGIIEGPKQALQGIGGAMGDQWSQGLDLAKQGRLTEGVGHMTAGSLPILGPTAANIGEEIAQGDIAGGVGKAAGLLAPFAMKPAANAAARLTPKGLRATIAESLEAKAGTRYADVMAPKVGANKVRLGNRAAKIGTDLAKDPEMGAFSREGLHGKVQQGLEGAKQMMDEAADAGLATNDFATEPILDGLKKARAKLVAEAIDADRMVPSLEGQGGRPTPSGLTRNIGTGRMQRSLTKQGRPLGHNVEPAPNAARISAIDQVIKEVEQLGPRARYESLRRIRQAWDGEAKPIYSPAVTADYLKVKGRALGAADATGVLREHLAGFSPKTAAANEAYALYRTADDVLSATQEVERTRPKVGRAIMARLTGSMAGGQAAGAPGMAAGWVLGPVIDAMASSAPTLKLQSAQLMTKLARAIRAGEVEQASSLIARLQKLVPASAVGVAQQTALGRAERRAVPPAGDTAQR
jgi:hypothetical protein